MSKLRFVSKKEIKTGFDKIRKSRRVYNPRTVIREEREEQERLDLQKICNIDPIEDTAKQVKLI